MARTDLLKGIGVFAVIVAVVLAGTFATGVVVSGSSNTSAAPNVSAYQPSSLLTTPVDDSGTVDAPDTNETKTVVIDKSHSNVIAEGEIQPLVDALVADGHAVRFYTGGQSSGFGTGSGLSGGSNLNSTLETADAFVVVNPGTTYSEGEINGVESFADAGGRVLMLADPVGPSTATSTTSIPLIGSSGGSTVTPGQPTNLAARFGISFGSGYLFNMSENANNFQSVYARAAGNGSLTEGVDRLVVRDATPLTTTTNATAVVESDASLSSTRRAGTYTLAARVGNVTTVGDTDFLAPASATVADNDPFLGNLAGFLVTGNKTAPAPAQAETGNGTGGFTMPTQPGSGSGSAP